MNFRNRVELTLENGVAHVQLVRADKMNALDPDMFAAIMEAGMHLFEESAARRHGRLALDPLARQATIDGCPLRLFPREFALLWRLSDEPGIPVSRAELLHDVLGLSIEPGTNALAVHICRLRKKLHSARLSHLLITGPGNGSYALLFDDASPRRFGLRNGLDEAGFSGEDVSLLEEAAE